MGVQIAFGCVYFAGNLNTEQQFYENVASFLPMWAVSLIQLGFAAAATWYVLGKAGFRKNKYLRAYVCIFMLTVPFFLQMHMARLVWSAAFSSFLWLLGLAFETMKNGVTGKRKAALLFAYVLYGTVCPEGVWLGGILLLAAFFLSRKYDSEKRTKERRGGNILLVLTGILAAGMIFAANQGLNHAFPQARGVYRESNPGMAVLSRLVWPNFGRHYYFWPNEVKEVLSEEKAVEIGRRPELVAEEFYFPLEETYGKRKAVELCLEMGKSCLRYRTKEIISEIGGDFADYFLLPFTIEKNLKGEGVSLTAWNYGRMRKHTPMLVKYYFRYGIFELSVLLLGSILLWASRGADHMRQLLRKRTAGQNYILFTLVFYTFWYTMSGNFPVDYKEALPILFIWYLVSVTGLMEEEGT